MGALRGPSIQNAHVNRILIQSLGSRLANHRSWISRSQLSRPSRINFLLVGHCGSGTGHDLFRRWRFSNINAALWRCGWNVMHHNLDHDDTSREDSSIFFSFSHHRSGFILESIYRPNWTESVRFTVYVSSQVRTGRRAKEGHLR